MGGTRRTSPPETGKGPRHGFHAAGAIMKGHIFNLFEQFIVEAAGAEAYERIHESCEFQGSGVFVRPGNYPDADLFELVDKALKHLGLTAREGHVAFGKWVFPHLAELAPHEAADVKHPKTLLMKLDDIHHVELKKLWPDARPPQFRCEDTGPNSMSFTYDSPREMFDLVDGVLQGVESYYSVPLRWEKSFRDSEAGHRLCRFDLTFG